MKTLYDRVIVEAAGHRVEVLMQGWERAGPLVVFFHGITLSARFWLPHMPPALRDGCAWASVTMPGHYPSVAPAAMRCGPVDWAAYAAAILGTIREIAGGRSVVLIGYSLGGYAVLAAAARLGAQVAGVCSISGFAEGQESGTFGLVQRAARGGLVSTTVFEVNRRLFSHSPTLHRLVIGYYAADRCAYFASDILRDTLDAVYFDVGGHDPAIMRQLFASLYDINILADLPRITAPALLMAGTEDTIIPIAHQTEMAEYLPQATLHVFDGVGHMFFAERTAAYHRLLTDWVGRVIRGAQPERGAA